MKKTLLVGLFMIAFLERVVFDLGANVELITTVMILASFYLGGKQSFWLTFLILVLTDVIIGNTSIFIFTWSGFLIPAVFVGYIFKNIKPKLKNRLKPQVFFSTGFGLGANLFFYFWTNFGVWLLDSWDMYANGVSGLLASYINALPFLKMQAVSSLIFIPSGFAAIRLAKLASTKISLNKAGLLTNKQ